MIFNASNVTNQPEEILEATNASVVEANHNILTEIDTLPFLTIEPFEPDPETVKTRKQTMMTLQRKKLNLNLTQFTKIQETKS